MSTFFKIGLYHVMKECTLGRLYKRNRISIQTVKYIAGILHRSWYE